MRQCSTDPPALSSHNCQGGRISSLPASKLDPSEGSPPRGRVERLALLAVDAHPVDEEGCCMCVCECECMCRCVSVSVCAGV